MLVPNTEVAILGTGSQLAANQVTNAELESRISGYDGASGDFSIWVDRVSHIQSRPMADPEVEDAGSIGKAAALKAIEASGVDPSEIDQLILCSFTVRDLFPGDHCRIFEEMGLRGGACMLGAACAGSLWGLTMARSLVLAGQCRNVLVVGSECLTHAVDFTDPITAILFSDMSGAAVVGRKTDGEPTGFLGPSVLRSSWNPTAISMWNPAAPRKANLTDDARREMHRAHLRMEGGPRVLRRAVQRMCDAVVEVLGFTPDDLKNDTPELREILDRAFVIPHQANGRILDGVQDKLRISEESLYRTIYFTGNASAATNLVSLDYAVRVGNLRRIPPEDGSGKMGEIVPCGRPLEKGDVVVVTSIGAGYLYGATAFVHAY